MLAALRSPRSWPAAGVLPPLRDRVASLFDLTERRRRHRPEVSRLLPQDLLDRSRRRALALAGSGPVGLVHGDLHPANVLRTGRGAVAIDPRPCLGDPAFDVIDWILTGTTGRHDIDHRIDRLAGHLPDLDPDRALAWCHATAALLAAGILRRAPHDPRARMLMDLADRPTPAVPTTWTPPPAGPTHDRRPRT